MKIKKVGTGITEYTINISDDPRSLRKRIEDIVEEAQFEKVFHQIFHWCIDKLPDDIEVIDTTQIEEGDDSEEGYALRILDALCTAKNHYDQELYDFTMVSMLTIGLLMKEANMKYEWEEFALSGQKSFMGSMLENERRTREANKKDEIARIKAMEIRERHPDWNKNDIANQLSKEMKALGYTDGVNPNTLRLKDYIK